MGRPFRRRQCSKSAGVRATRAAAARPTRRDAAAAAAARIPDCSQRSRRGREPVASGAAARETQQRLFVLSERTDLPDRDMNSCVLSERCAHRTDSARIHLCARLDSHERLKWRGSVQYLSEGPPPARPCCLRLNGGCAERGEQSRSAHHLVSLHERRQVRLRPLLERSCKERGGCRRQGQQGAHSAQGVLLLCGSLRISVLEGGNERTARCAHRAGRRRAGAGADRRAGRRWGSRQLQKQASETSSSAPGAARIASYTLRCQSRPTVRKGFDRGEAAHRCSGR